MPDVFVSSAKNKKNVTKPALNALPLGKEHLELLRKEKDGQQINIPQGVDKHKLSGHSHNPLSAFSFYPDRIKFANADTEEKIVLLLRRHPITNIPWILISFFMIIAPSFVSVLPLFETLSVTFKLVIFLTWYLITTAFILEEFLEWFFNVNLVTDERIFDVDFVNLMYREITEADIDQIQDVTVEVGGAARTFFGYGNVYIQTAAQVPRIEFHAVPHPDRVAKILRELGIEEEVEKIEGRIR